MKKCEGVKFKGKTREVVPTSWVSSNKKGLYVCLYLKENIQQLAKVQEHPEDDWQKYSAKIIARSCK